MKVLTVLLFVLVATVMSSCRYHAKCAAYNQVELEQEFPAE